MCLKWTMSAPNNQHEGCNNETKKKRNGGRFTYCYEHKHLGYSADDVPQNTADWAKQARTDDRFKVPGSETVEPDACFAPGCKNQKWVKKGGAIFSCCSLECHRKWEEAGNPRPAIRTCQLCSGSHPVLQCTHMTAEKKEQMKNEIKYSDVFSW